MKFRSRGLAVYSNEFILGIHTVVVVDMTDDNATGSYGNNESLTAIQPAKEIIDTGWLLVATIEIYVTYVVIGIGIVGTAANAVILYALFLHNAREAKKRMVNWLIINQNLLDPASGSEEKSATKVQIDL